MITSPLGAEIVNDVNAVVDSDPENERNDDRVRRIERDPENPHQTERPNDSDHHRNQRQKG